ncbi:LysR family transcriptional regulator [Corynebacterium sp. ES2794-CONJ1]|uniref:LysR family transcriptional regulator n=1 Tax=unclassified Corynebacterium TaxID=2624378 RepID=UPI002167E0B2|nr:MULTISPECIES: LysR family transcriptional regulator [unclassified Corynebacterium]MCS4489560.1 LysR family transcriptional regulator [Corynebacterium sp. ES2775-CONJ]MCS4491429.1 LysR family transcriptional regulator [Corynebacterium sp. ES2715-CONJ3]MCS4531470.1 LysR family transcriptional regulator [Corynebacterium sp. ES2730-CONJ]MCU9518858.1 LysR family transcriptional regulator [Corynebacterium sp. ES2794-CONJ1]
MRIRRGIASNLYRLRMLVELRRLGTMSEVAEILLLTHSAVSQQLKQLEKEVGYTLIEKSGRRVRLTDRGEILADYGHRMLTLADEAAAALKDQRDIRGHLKIASFQSALVGLISSIVTDMAVQHPDLKLEFHQYEVDAAIAQLLSAHVDVIIGEELPFMPALDTPGMHREDLYHEDMVLACPTHGPWAKRCAHVRDFKELAPVPFLLNPQSSVAGYWERNFCLNHGFMPTALLESPDPLLQLNLVAQGVGVAILPSLVLHNYPANILLKALPGHPQRVIFTAVREGREAYPAIQTLRATLAGAWSNPQEVDHTL